MYEKWNTRVSTGLLNKWSYQFQRVQKMPTDMGRTLKIRYIMQIKTRPPTFFVYTNDKNLMDANFERFLRNSIAEEFGFEGVPVRLLIRDSKLQYARSGSAGLLSANTRAVLQRIRQHKMRMQRVTYRRRLAGNRFLYRK